VQSNQAKLKLKSSDSFCKKLVVKWDNYYSDIKYDREIEKTRN